MNLARLAALLLVPGLVFLRPAPPPQADPARLAVGVEQLRHTVGDWAVKTEFLDPEGNVAATAEGTYTFRWVVPDRVLTGESDLPPIGRKSAILFYVNEARSHIEMCSVGADGELWVMSGPIDGEVRTTELRTLPDGSTIQLRFTREAVEPDSFESRMEVRSSADGEWRPGNHQVFRRKT